MLIIFLSPTLNDFTGRQNEVLNFTKAQGESDITDQLSSSFTGKNYLLEIDLPYDYDPDKSEGYPVLYFPNYWDRNRGGNIFNYYWRMHTNVNFTEVFENSIIPSMIMVGITITEDEFTISNFEDDMIDNPNLYHQFLQEELVPYIDENYNTDLSQRILMGWVQLGFFIVDTFFRYPDTPFTKFVSVDGDLQPPSTLIEDVPYIFSRGEDFVERFGEGAEIDIDIFLSASKTDYDSYFPMREISKSIHRRGYEKLNLRTIEFDDGNIWSYGFQAVEGLYGVYNPEMFVKYRIEDQDVYVNEEVQFTFTGALGNRTQVVYNWDFGDGTNSSERSPSHIYSVAGGYKANLTINDEYNRTYSYVYPATLQIKLGERPIDLDETSLDLQNTESYKTKEQDVNEARYSMSWLILVPILMLGRKRLSYR